MTGLGSALEQAQDARVAAAIGAAEAFARKVGLSASEQVAYWKGVAEGAMSEHFRYVDGQTRGAAALPEFPERQGATG